MDAHYDPGRGHNGSAKENVYSVRPLLPAQRAHDSPRPEEQTARRCTPAAKELILTEAKVQTSTLSNPPSYRVLSSPLYADRDTTKSHSTTYKPYKVGDRSSNTVLSWGKLRYLSSFPTTPHKNNKRKVKEMLSSLFAVTRGELRRCETGGSVLKSCDLRQESTLVFGPKVQGQKNREKVTLGREK